MESTSPDVLAKAIEIYKEKYGKGQVEIPKLDEIIRELKGDK